MNSSICFTVDCEAIVWKSWLSSHDLPDISREGYKERSLVRR